VAKQKMKNNQPIMELAGALMVLAFAGLHWPNSNNVTPHFHNESCNFYGFVIAMQVTKHS